MQMFHNFTSLLENYSAHMTMILHLCDDPCGKVVSDSVPNMVKSQIQPMGAVKKRESLLSFVVRL